MESSSFSRLYPEISDFNDILEQFRIFVRDLKEVKKEDKETIDVKLKRCRLTTEKLAMSPINRFEYLNQTCNIIENLFGVIKKPKRLKNIDLILIGIFQKYCKMLNEKIYLIANDTKLVTQPSAPIESSPSIYPEI